MVVVGTAIVPAKGGFVVDLNNLADRETEMTSPSEQGENALQPTPSKAVKKLASGLTRLAKPP
jgi:hypothetical protein